MSVLGRIIYQGRQKEISFRYGDKGRCFSGTNIFSCWEWKAEEKNCIKSGRRAFQAGEAAGAVTL